MNEKLDKLIDNIAEDLPDRNYYHEDHCSRVIKEILDDVDVYTASAKGPEGPWYYKSLSITRIMNNIYIKDADYVTVDTLTVPDLSDVEDPYTLLGNKFEKIHKNSLNSL